MNGDQTKILDADRIRELLTELGRRLDERGLSAQLFVVGGAAMALAFNSRRVTRDLDGVFEPKAEVYEDAAGPGCASSRRRESFLHNYILLQHWDSQSKSLCQTSHH